MAEPIQWKSSQLVDEDSFFDALVTEMEADGTDGAGVSGLLELVKTSHPDWYQVGESARSLRQAFNSPPVPVGASTESPRPNASSGHRPGTRTIAGVVALIAGLGAVAALGYGYLIAPTKVQSPNPATEIALTQSQLDAIAASVSAKLPRGLDTGDLTKLAEQQSKLIADLRAEFIRANQSRDVAETTTQQLRGKVAELQKSLHLASDQLTDAKAETLAMLQTEREKHAKEVDQLGAEAKRLSDARREAEQANAKLQAELKSVTALAAQYAPLAKTLNNKEGWSYGKGQLLGIDWATLPDVKGNEKGLLFCVRVSPERLRYMEAIRFKAELKEGKVLELLPLAPK